MEKIRLNVSLEFEPKIAATEEKIRDLQRQLQWTGGENAVALRKQLAGEEEKVKKLYKAQVSSIEEQYKIQKGQEEARKAMIEGIDEENFVSSELTDTEKERLDIEKQLIQIRGLGSATLENQIEKEIELTKQSKFLYEAHEKNLKLEELNNKLLDARLDKRKKEIDQLVDLSMKYEQADALEKGRIRRFAELATMKPEEIALAFQGSMYDRRIIEEYWTSFSQEAQLAIAKTMDLFKELSAKLPEIAVPTTITPEVVAGAKAGAAAVTNNIVGAQIQQVNVNLPEIDWESLADKAGEQVAERLKSDEAFQELVAKGIRNKV